MHARKPLLVDLEMFLWCLGAVLALVAVKREAGLEDPETVVQTAGVVYFFYGGADFLVVEFGPVEADACVDAWDT